MFCEAPHHSHSHTWSTGLSIVQCFLFKNILFFEIFVTTFEHVHSHLNSISKVPDNYLAEIKKLHQNRTKPIDILKSLKRTFASQFDINITQVRYQISKLEKDIEPVVNFGDLCAWLRSMKTVPNGEDVPFVLSFTQNPATKHFNAVFSTKRLLSHSVNQRILCADSTYKLVWQNYAITFVGTFDAMHQFHVLCASISTNETSRDYQFTFSALKSAVLKHFKHDLTPDCLMADAAYTIQNGFSGTFSYVCDVSVEPFALMCWFHVCKALKEFKYADKTNKDAIKVDVKFIQQSPNYTIFKFVCKLFRTKWEPSEPDFCRYFEKEWETKHPFWFGGARPERPDSNNGIEGFNSSVKANHTVCERQPLTKFK